MEDNKHASLTLFGGDKGWHAEDWTDSDDRVRGGSSQSYLDIDEKTAYFHGTLDTKTLGGAGFASQRTTGDDRSWDLSDYRGVKLNASTADKKRYTFILKDTLLPPDEKTGREQSTISWECDFELPPQTEPGDVEDAFVYIPFTSFNPTYRGKLQTNVDPIDLSKVKRMSIMMRSFFDTQAGDFSLTLTSITAETNAPKHSLAATCEPTWLEAGLDSPENNRRLYWNFVLQACCIGVLLFTLALLHASDKGWI